MTQAHRLILFTLGALFFGDVVTGQEMRIYTTVRDRSTAAAGKLQDQRSLMIFHAGKVYDYIEPAQEVTIFEPAHRRFIVVNLRRQLRSELMQDQIRKFLGMAEDEAQKRLAFADENLTPAARKSLELLQFQLKPEFVTTFDPSKAQLMLANPRFQYVAAGLFAPPSQDFVDKYLHVADWMAQFNSVLHPQSLLPGPRIKLNQELRSHGLLPSTVELQASSDFPIHLQAQHVWTWNLQTTDRQMIDEWEKQLQNPEIRIVSFLQFQQEMLKR